MQSVGHHAHLAEKPTLQLFFCGWTNGQMEKQTNKWTHMCPIEAMLRLLRHASVAEKCHMWSTSYYNQGAWGGGFLGGIPQNFIC